MNNTQNRVAVVTGASRGIGRAIAIRLAANGYRIFVNYSSGTEGAQETCKLCVEAGGQAEPLQFTVSDSAAVDKAFDLVKEKAGGIHLLVNNAGITRDGLFVRMKDEDWNQVIQTNLTGAFYCSRAASKIMMKARFGRIINISSIVGEMGNAGQVPYVSSKAGMLGLTKSIAREMASRNVTVNAITPGFIETDMTAALDEKVREEHLKSIPLGRYGQSAEIAALVTFLASDDAGYITGQVIGVNGGMYM